MKIRNTFIIFLVSGFWHGANWTFIFWGFLNACYFLPLLLLNINRKNIDIVAKGRLLPNFKEIIMIGITYLLTIFAWIFFRAENIGKAFYYVAGIFSPSFFQKPDFLRLFPKGFIFPLLLFFVVEWLGREGKYPLEKLLISNKRLMRWSFYILLILFIGLFKRPDNVEFIYFQF
jgi:hypothetical protein